LGLEGNNLKIATKNSWKIFEMPKSKIELKINPKIYSSEEFIKIKEGFIPREMEDKWFIYFENNKLYFHRSWSGFCAYEVIFIKNKDSFQIEKVYFNEQIYKDKSQIDNKYESNLLLYLIDRILLGKKINFPDTKIKLDTNLKK